MIIKPKGYDEAQTYGDKQILKPGGYILIIKKAEPHQDKNGNPMLKISYDIAEGEFQGFYAKAYKANTRQDKKWSGVSYQGIEGSDITLSIFKGFITSIEESNQGYKWNWDEETLTGKYIGGIFGREQYEKDGKLNFSTKLFSWRSVATIRKGIEIPADKLLKSQNNSNTSYMPDVYKSQPQPNFQDVTDDDDLPF